MGTLATFVNTRKCFPESLRAGATQAVIQDDLAGHPVQAARAPDPTHAIKEVIVEPAPGRDLVDVLGLWLLDWFEAMKERVPEHVLSIAR